MGGEALLQSAYVPLERARDSPWRQEGHLGADEQQQAGREGRPPRDLGEAWTYDWSREPQALIGGTRERRKLQAVGADRETLLATPREQLTDQEQIQLVPDWQRRLISTSDQGRDNAMLLVRARLRTLYGGSVCNATDGCDLRFGNCLNVTGLNVYQYDQNGTCACHHWFQGDDCSTTRVSCLPL